MKVVQTIVNGNWEMVCILEILQNSKAISKNILPEWDRKDMTQQETDIEAQSQILTVLTHET